MSLSTPLHVAGAWCGSGCNIYNPPRRERRGVERSPPLLASCPSTRRRENETGAGRAIAPATARPAARPALRALVVAVYVDAVLWSIPAVRPISEAVVRAGYSRWLIGSAGLAFAAGAIVYGWRRLRARAAAAAALAYGALIAYLSAAPDEVVHIAEYGVLSLLAWWMLAPAAGRGAPWAALALTSLVGFVDECTQGATPGRYFDWRDVAVNSIAAAVPIWLGRLARRSTEAS